MANKKYWEVEAPKELWGEKSVVKIYTENGKIQVFPRVPTAKYGIGKGATLDLETLSTEHLLALKQLVDEAVNNQLTTDLEEAN